jgi:hypothetical protein
MKHLVNFDQINELFNSTLDNAAIIAQKRGFKQLADKFRSHANQTIYSSSEKNPTFTVVYNLSTDRNTGFQDPLEFIARSVSYYPWREGIDEPYPTPINCLRIGTVKVIVEDPKNSHFSKDEIIRISLSFCNNLLILGLIDLDMQRVLLLNRHDAKKFINYVNKDNLQINVDPRSITFSYVSESSSQEISDSKIESQVEKDSSDPVSVAKQLMKNERNLGVFLKKFGTIANDPKVQIFLEQVDDLDKINASTSFIKAIDLIPSQQEVGLGNSVKDLISAGTYDDTQTDNELEALLRGGRVTLLDKAKNLIVVTRCPGTDGGESKTWVIDGHHRWSKACVANPKVELECIVFDPVVDFDIIEVLKAFHIALFKTKGESTTEQLIGENLFTCSDQIIRDYVVNTENKSEEKLKIWTKYISSDPPQIQKEVVNESSEVESDGANLWEKVIDTLIENRETITQVRNENSLDSSEYPTPRTVMPQVTNSNRLKDDFPNKRINIHTEGRIIKNFNNFFEL